MIKVVCANDNMYVLGPHILVYHTPHSSFLIQTYRSRDFRKKIIIFEGCVLEFAWSRN